MGCTASEMSMDSERKVVIVTGASSGIGEAAAREFGKLGARLVLAARRVERLEAVCREIEAFGTDSECLAVQADLSTLEGVIRVVEQTRQRWDRVDVLVNNAGFGRLDWLENLDPINDIQAQIDVNVMGVIQTTRQVLPIMIRQRSGTIINICSIAGLIGTPTYTIYAASKHAVHGFSEALRREVQPWGIHVCLLYPGRRCDRVWPARRLAAQDQGHHPAVHASHRRGSWQGHSGADAAAAADVDHSLAVAICGLA